MGGAYWPLCVSEFMGLFLLSVDATQEHLLTSVRAPFPDRAMGHVLNSAEPQLL